MMEIPAYMLSDGDAFSPFTTSDVLVWRTVKVVREADKGRRHVVIDTDGKEHVFKSLDRVLVK